jgi:exonuclease III
MYYRGTGYCPFYDPLRTHAVPSTRFLFWNINRKPLAKAVADLALADQIDVVILVECEVDPVTLLLALNSETGSDFHYSPGNSKAIRIFTRFSRDFLRPIWESDRISIRRLALPARSEILLAAAHLPSGLHWNRRSQNDECGELARLIAAEEEKVGHRRTVVVGDFNVNPFDPGMISTVGLHAVSSRQIASRKARTVQGREYPFFYNPMWGHFGDAAGDTAGSYFYDSAQHVNYFWNMFDQVLMRPDLAGRFDSTQLRIVKSVGAQSLVRPDGRPDPRFSDHLPFVFELEF